MLADIDYSTMKAKKFVPIGTDITIEDSGTTVYHYPFTGTFDGQGFVIKNLYLADYNTITTIIVLMMILLLILIFLYRILRDV